MSFQQKLSLGAFQKAAFSVLFQLKNIDMAQAEAGSCVWVLLHFLIS